MPATIPPRSRTSGLRAGVRGLTAALVIATLAATSPAQDRSVKLITRNQLESDAHVVRDVRSTEIKLLPLVETHAIPVVTALVADPSSGYLAVAGDDHAIRIVDVHTGHTIETMKGHTDWIHALAFDVAASPLATPTLYSAGDDGLVLHWRQGLRAPQEIDRFEFAIRSLSLSSHQQLLAIAGYGPQIVIWDLASSRYRYILHCDCGDQRCVRFSPDGRRLLCGGRDGDISVWDTQSGNKTHSLPAHQGHVYTASFSADGDRITSVGEDRRLVQFDLNNGQSETHSLELPAKLMAMCLINDSVVALAGADNSIQLYDFAANAVIADLRQHTGTVAVMCPVGNALASGSFDTTVRIWDLTSIESQRGAGDQYPVHFTPLNVDDQLRIR